MHTDSLRIPQNTFENIEINVFETKTKPGIYEIVKRSNINNQSIYFSVEADTRTMRSITTKSSTVVLNSDLKLLLGFTKKQYSAGLQKSKKPVMITSFDKIHLKCD